MNKYEYLKTFNALESFFKDQQILDALDALKFVSDIVNNHEDELFTKKNNSSGTTFDLPETVKNKKNTFAIFSDGACRGNPGPGAWGTIVQNSKGDVTAELSGVDFNTTNNKMELLGAIEGLKHLVKINDENAKDITIHLYSDSKYLVDGINKWILGWKKRGWKKADKKPPENLELWQLIDKIRTNFKIIYFHWVKGHAGHPQNEHCDKLANLALDDAGLY